MAATDTPTISSLDLFNLSGVNVLITGATRGIGLACAQALLDANASICLLTRPSASVPQSLKTLHKQQRITSVTADLSTLSSGDAQTTLLAAESALEGPIDVLVNCHGIQRRAKSVDFEQDTWNEVLHGGLTVPAYAAAKGALAQLTKALSNEWAKDGIQVNGIAPGYIETDMNEALLADPLRFRQISERIPAGRWGKPADFAGPIIFLASKASMYVSGEILVVDGGWMGR